MTRIGSLPHFINFGHTKPFTTAQIRSDALLESFSSQSTHLSSIANFALAGLTGQIFRHTFLASRFFNTNFINTLGGHFVGLLAESGFLTFSQHPSQSSTQDHLKEFRSHFMNLACLRITGAALHMSPALLRHSSASIAQVAAHHLAIQLGWEERTQCSLTEEFFEAEITNWQFEIGNQLGNIFTGYRISHFQKQLEHSSRQYSSNHSIPANSLLQLTSEDSTLAQNEGNQRNPRNIKFHPNFEVGWAVLPESIRTRTLRAIELVSSHNRNKGLDKKKLRANSPLMQAKVSDQCRLLFIKRGNTYEFLNIGAHNETDRLIRRWCDNPPPESNHSFNPFLSKERTNSDRTPESENTVEIRSQMSPEDWAEHWKRHEINKRDRRTTVSEEELEIQEASQALVDPNKVLKGNLDKETALKYPELLLVNDEELIGLSENCPWRGDASARTFLHFQGLQARLSAFEGLHPVTRRALTEMEEYIAVANSSDCPENTASLLLKEYDKIHPLDRLHLLLPEETQAAKTPNELGKNWLNFLISRESSGNELDNLVSATLSQNTNILQSLVIWSVRSSRKIFQQGTRGIPADIDYNLLLEQNFPEIDFAEADAGRPYTYQEWRALSGSNVSHLHSFIFWNQAPENFRKVMRVYHRLLGNGISQTKLYRYMGYLARIGSLGANQRLLTDHAYQLFNYAISLDATALRNAASEYTDPFSLVERCSEVGRVDPELPAEFGEIPDIQKFFGPRNRIFSALIRRILSHPQYAERFSNFLWAHADERELEDLPLQQWIQNLHRKTAAFYLKNRADFRKVSPSTNPFENDEATAQIEKTAIQFPNDFPEVFLIPWPSVGERRSRNHTILTELNPADTTTIADITLPNGSIRTVGLNDENANFYKSQTPFVPFELDGITHEIGNEVDYHPYTATARWYMHLENIMHPEVYRLFTIATRFQTTTRPIAKAMGNKASNLMLAGVPPSLVLGLFHKRFPPEYAQQRDRLIEEIERRDPDFPASTFARSPELDLLGESLQTRIILDDRFKRGSRIYKERQRIFELYTELSNLVSGSDPLKEDNLKLSISRALGRFMLHHRRDVLDIFGIPPSYLDLLNSLGSHINETKTPELVRTSHSEEAAFARVTPPEGVDRNSFFFRLYFRTTVFMSLPPVSNGLPFIASYIKNELGPLARRNGPAAIFHALAFYLKHRENIVAHLPPELR